VIGKLKGVIDCIAEDHTILDVHGVGYVVHCSSRTLQNLPSIGEAAVLSIEMYVREDMIRLYGFSADSEREWFRLLQNVQGVGAKVALGILSVLDPAMIATAIATGDKGMVARGPGVGPKLAARIVAELKDKAPALSGFEGGMARLSGAGLSKVPQPAQDAVSALVNLGYGQSQASLAIAAVLQQVGEDAETKILIRLGLKELATS
jgi:holliday junction DNA helicase RuvA